MLNQNVGILMNWKLDELTKRIAQSAKRRDALNTSLGSVYLINVLMAFVLLALHAQPIQPDILFIFRHGNLPHQPENPYGNLVEGIDGSFYGTSVGGGNYHRGTVFKVTTNGLITLVASFNNTNGATPYAGLAVGSDGNFYGTTSQGVGSTAGTVFKASADRGWPTLVSS